MNRIRPAPSRPVCAIVVCGTALLLLAACGGGGGGGGAVGGEDPAATLTMVSSDPADGAQGVPVDAEVRVAFSVALDPATVTTRSLRVGIVEGAGETPGTATLDPDDGRVLTWRPSGRMAALTAHACMISSALRSTSGAAPSGTLTFAFRTGAPATVPGLPSNGDFRATIGQLNVGRRSHTATSLGGGAVLVAGGFSQGEAITDVAEVYLPSPDHFEVLSNRMAVARAGHTATRLADGRVLLTGGWIELSPGQLGTTGSAEIYDPGTHGFTEIGPMTSARVDHAALLMSDGRVLITGGSRLEGNFLADLDSAEVFHPSTNTFQALPNPMVHTRATHAMVALGSGLYVLVGGSDVDLRPSVFDPTDGTFSALSTPAQEGQRWGAFGDSFASGGAVIGGGDVLGTTLFAEADGTAVRNAGSGLTSPRAYGTATRYADDRILVVGGFDFSRGLYMLPTVDVWVEGGLGGAQTYAATMRFPHPMVYHTATLLPSGKILFCGGLNEMGGEPELDTAYVFTPPATGE